MLTRWNGSFTTLHSSSGVMPADSRTERRRTPRIELPFPVTVRGLDQAGDRFTLETVLDSFSAAGLSLRLIRPVALRIGRLLPFLGALLVLLLLGGALLALRGENQAGERVSATATAVPVAQATASSAEATAVAPQEATPIPEVTAAPTVQPNPTSAASTVAADPISQLRALLVAGGADGRVSEDGKDLVEKLDEAQRALDKGDTKEAEKQLHELQKKLLEGPGKGVIDSEFAREALAGIDAVAGSYGLDLPFSVTTG